MHDITVVHVQKYGIIMVGVKIYILLAWYTQKHSITMVGVKIYMIITIVHV